MSMWRSRKQSLLGVKGTVPAWYLCGSGGDIEKVSKGYVLMVLVDDREEDDLQGQKIIMVHILMRRYAEQQFGLNQRGVLRIPYNVIHFNRARVVHVERFRLII
jgi:hypothetical protein